MSAPKSIIAPGQHAPKGLIPRNLMVGGFLLISGVAILWFLAQGSSAPPPDPQARVKAQLQESAATAERGNPAMVDQAAKQAPANVQAAAAKAAAEAASAASAASASSVPRPVAATSGPIEPGYERGLPAPEGGGQRTPQRTASQLEPSGRTSAVEPGAAEREMASREAPAIVFDRGKELIARKDGSASSTQEPASPVAEINRAIADLSKSSSSGPDAATQAILDLARAQVPGKQESKQDSQARWRESVRAGGSNAEVLIPSPPPGRYLLRVGKVIPAVTTREITSEAEGVVTARTTENLYDSAGNLLAPAGSELVGAADTRVTFGQSRMNAAFTQLRLPNGYTFYLPAAKVSDALGRGGVTGDVDRHFFQSFGSALVLGLLSDRVSQSSKLPNSQMGISGSSSGLSATGQVFVDTARIELERAKGIAPTITVPAGSRINVEVERDMQFPGPYKSWSNR